MKKVVYGVLASALLACVLFGGLVSTAQDRGGRGNFDPEQMRQRIMDRMKEQLQAGDDEWQIIQPKIEKVWELQRESRSGGMGFGMFGPPPGGPGGPGGPNGDNNGDRGGRRRGFGPEPSPEAAALQQVLDNKDASADEIKAKLTAYRDSVKKKETELAKAREDLRAVLTVRQEAMLVLMSVLN
ncbi:MAG: hypothetical protein GC154_14910 [bacterium]|nr:hypothetical protein [bacterium]